MVLDALHPRHFAHHFEQFLDEGLSVSNSLGFWVLIVLSNELFEVDVFGVVVEGEGVDGEQGEDRPLQVAFPLHEGEDGRLSSRSLMLGLLHLSSTTGVMKCYIDVTVSLSTKDSHELIYQSSQTSSLLPLFLSSSLSFFLPSSLPNFYPETELSPS